MPTEAAMSDQLTPTTELNEALNLLNSLGIYGPNLGHVEWTPDSHMPEPYPGPGWCVCGRVQPCEAKRLGELIGSLALASQRPDGFGRSERAEAAAQTAAAVEALRKVPTGYLNDEALTLLSDLSAAAEAHDKAVAERVIELVKEHQPFFHKHGDEDDDHWLCDLIECRTEPYDEHILRLAALTQEGRRNEYGD